jgi:hypothetical protein
MNPLLLAALFAALGRMPIPADHISSGAERATPDQPSLAALPALPARLDWQARAAPDIFNRVIPHAPLRPTWGALGARLQSALHGVPLADGKPAPRLLPNLRREVVDALGTPRHVGLHGVTLTVSGQF